MDKQELRKTTIARLAALCETERQIEDVAIIKHILGQAQWSCAQSIFCYAPYGWEINTFPLMEAALFKGKRLSVPCIGIDGAMAAKQITSLAELKRGRYGIYAPPATNPTTAPKDIDLVIVPGVAFEIQGLLRLGRGGGYYDRYLACTDALRMALARTCQLTEKKIVVDEHDLTMDMLITKDGVYCR